MASLSVTKIIQNMSENLQKIYLSTVVFYKLLMRSLSRASWFAAGIIPGPFKTDCDLLASTVDTSARAFSNFFDDVAAKAKALRQAEPAMIATAQFARREAQKASATKKANQSTLVTTAMYPGQVCFNCQGIDHKVQRCPEHCKSPTCPVSTHIFRNIVLK